MVESKTIDELPIIDEEFLEPFLPFSPLLTEKEAQQSMEAKSFWLDFGDGILPTSIVIGNNLLNGSIKAGREYTVVTVPYTLLKVGL